MGLHSFIGRRCEWPGKCYHVSLITSHWRCGEAPVSAILSFPKRRLFSVRGGHQVVRALTILSLLPACCPKTTYTGRHSFQKSVFLLLGQLRLCCQVSCELAAAAQQHWLLFPVLCRHSTSSFLYENSWWHLCSLCSLCVS